VPGATSHAFRSARSSDAYRLKNVCEFWKNLLQTKLSSNCGATVASNWLVGLADRPGTRSVPLIELTDRIPWTSPEFNSQQLVKPWKRGVFGFRFKTKVEEIGPDTIALSTKSWTLSQDLVTVEREQLPVRTSAIKKPARSITTTPIPQVVDHPEIFALGDLAESRDAEGRQCAQRRLKLPTKLTMLAGISGLP